MDPVRLAEVNARLRRRGLPQTPLYQSAEQQRMLEEMRRRRRAQIEGQVRRSQEFRDNTSELTAEQRRIAVNQRMDQALADVGLRGDYGRGPLPRAEPDQVVRQAEKGKDGKFVGRKAGAVAANLVDKIADAAHDNQLPERDPRRDPPDGGDAWFRWAHGSSTGRQQRNTVDYRTGLSQ